VIVVYHKNNSITKVVYNRNESIIVEQNKSIAYGIMELANKYPESTIVWCYQLLEKSLNIEGILTLFHHNKMMLSYGTTETSFLGKEIGFVEESPFIKVNKKCMYPTWLMSSEVGVIHASVLKLIGDKIKPDSNFDYYLNSIAKIGMPLGLLCYSEPKLLKSSGLQIASKAGIYTLFRFVKQHYKTRWVFLFGLNMALYERRVPLLPFLFSFFYKKRKNNAINLDTVLIQSSKKEIDRMTIDVIIPTIGRKGYLYDVLKDFSRQTLLPKKIIIVEQNPQEDSVTELDYILDEKWPFNIEHFFIHQTGACNARNIALKQITSEWIFFADDDIRIEYDFIHRTFLNIQKFGSKAVSINCLQNEEKQIFKNVIQWGSFGSGCSFVATSALAGCDFNMGYEFGFGEDSDFGMQLRNQGHDVLYLPEPEILHLKAPVGGFRTKPMLLWQKESIQPKPSPTVMLYLISHNTQEQLLGYKTILFFKYYKHQKIKNPYVYFRTFQKQWNQSVFWANQLKKQV
jgi:hypothetical protein